MTARPGTTRTHAVPPARRCRDPRPVAAAAGPQNPSAGPAPRTPGHRAPNHQKGHLDTVDGSQLITKYTGHHLDPAALIADRQVTGTAAALAAAIGQAALNIDDTETELTRLTPSITHHLTRVSTTITAQPGQPAPALNPVGELQEHARKFDTLIAVREERIQHLRALIQIWSTLPARRTGPLPA